MADTDYPLPENGAFWVIIAERFVFFGSREAEGTPASIPKIRSPSNPTIEEVIPNRFDSGDEVGDELASHSGWITSGGIHTGDEVEDDRASQISGFDSVRTATQYALAGLDWEQGIHYDIDIEDDSSMVMDRENFSEYEPDIEDDNSMGLEDNSVVAGTFKVTSNAAKYLFELELLTISDLQEDCQSCAICQEPYNTGDEPELPYVVGQCGHILGGTCLSKWVAPKGQKQNRTCPLCRDVLFDDNPPGDPEVYEVDEERLQDLLDQDADSEDDSDSPGEYNDSMENENDRMGDDSAI